MRRRRTVVRLTGFERVRARVRKVPTLGIGVVVEEHRDVAVLGPPFAERPCLVGSLRALGIGTAQRHEGHHVEHAEAGMFAFVANEGGPFGNCGCERPRPVARVSGAGPGEREHRPVVIGIGVHVDQRRAARLRQGPQQVHVAALGDVRDTFQHVNSVGPEG